MNTYMMFVDGEWVGSSDGGTYSVINPATGKPLAEVAKGTAEDAKRAIDAAYDSFRKGTWRRMTPSERARILLKLADAVEERISELAVLETQNTG
ncbi:MAG: aldehyde dehydrogenase family protein, partial [Nitrososphaeria archaeon]